VAAAEMVQRIVNSGSIGLDEKNHYGRNRETQPGNFFINWEPSLRILHATNDRNVLQLDFNA
jgi:hypothetical protein